MAQRRQALTDKTIAAIKKKDRAFFVPDPGCIGLYIKVAESGAKTFYAQAREPHGGKQRWTKLAPVDHLEIADARVQARDAIKRIKAGLPALEPIAPPSDSFQTVTTEYLKRHVAAKELISADEIDRILNFYVMPGWKNREFTSIRKSDVAKLLDKVQDENGARQADAVLHVVRAMMRWYSTRTDDYSCPITGAMRRTDPKKRKRDRVLSDEEIRLLWPLAEKRGAYGAMVKIGLTTAQRLDKIAAMKWVHVSDDGVWTVPRADREKGVGGSLGLPAIALEVIRAQPQIKGNEYVFAGRFAGHFNGFSRSKRLLDADILKELRKRASQRNEDSDRVTVAPWCFHDTRRTARSLLSRVGVQTEIAERVLGHVQADIVETYDRHAYHDEKKAALAKLAAELNRILQPGSENVVKFPRRKRGRAGS